MAFGRGKKDFGDAPEWLIVGLGNPGRQYEHTPHNIGFETLDELAQRTAVSFAPKFDGMLARMRLEREPVALLKPLTYMNLSGRSVRPASVQLQVAAEHVLVVHDEVDLPFGELRATFGGGLAGHNGLKSIAQLLRTQDFARLRIGAGRPDADDPRPLADWILSHWPPERDAELLARRAADVVETIVRDGLDAAMNAIN